MTWRTGRTRRQIFAEPLGENAWRVRTHELDGALPGPTIGFIDELGGTYEVRVLAEPSERHCVETFTAAMDRFGPEEPVALEPDSAELSPARLAAFGFAPVAAVAVRDPNRRAG